MGRVVSMMPASPSGATAAPHRGSDRSSSSSNSPSRGLPYDVRGEASPIAGDRSALASCPKTPTPTVSDEEAEIPLLESMVISDPELSSRGASPKTSVSSKETLMLIVMDPAPEVASLSVSGTADVASSHQDDKDLVLRAMLHSRLQLLKGCPLSDLLRRIEAFKECAHNLWLVHANGELFDHLEGVLTSYEECLAVLENNLVSRCAALEESELSRAQCLSEQVRVFGEIAKLSGDIQTTKDEIGELQARVAFLRCQNSSREEAVCLCSRSLDRLEPEAASACGLVDVAVRDIIELKEWKDRALHGTTELGDKIREAFDRL
ncbi:hypothetical protein AMTR_s00422p00007660 [Amborella trichopoda]|uniref:Uncharacterized protein n=1 Tax=Amborella trichopoda TaxID=13333 RepID=W1PQC7_AMBTC|nr:hypothetical protein AMTR_s00422p00007660 [Amborella trichopoda]